MKKLLIIGMVWPEPNTTAAGMRMMQLIAFFKTEGYEIHFASTAAKTSYSANLEQEGIFCPTIAINDPRFDAFIKKLQPQVVLFDRFITEEQFGWRVYENCPNAIRILDTEDLHFLRKTREIAFKNKTEITNSSWHHDSTKRELASILRCDLSLIISKYEINLLTQQFQIPFEQLIYLPFLLDRAAPHHDSLTFEERQDFMTIGNLKHEPNWISVKRLKTDIWPLIKQQLPQAKLHIYGAYAAQKVKQLHHEKDGFLIKGWTDDKSRVFTQHRVCLAPLAFGAGLKGKLFDAMRFGTPNITTNIGAEGMQSQKIWGGYIAETSEENAAKAVDLYTHLQQWQTAQKNGFKLVNQLFNQSIHLNNLKSKLAQLSKDLTQHRQQHFWQSLLWHHSLQSSKYLSKYIEAKNR